MTNSWLSHGCAFYQWWLSFKIWRGKPESVPTMPAHSTIARSWFLVPWHLDWVIKWSIRYNCSLKFAEWKAENIYTIETVNQIAVTPELLKYSPRFLIDPAPMQILKIGTDAKLAAPWQSLQISQRKRKHSSKSGTYCVEKTVNLHCTHDWFLPAWHELSLC